MNPWKLSLDLFVTQGCSLTLHYTLGDINDVYMIPNEVEIDVKSCGQILSYNEGTGITNSPRNNMGTIGACQIWILFILTSKAYETSCLIHTEVLCLLGLINPDVTLMISLKMDESSVWIIHRSTSVVFLKDI